MPNNRRRLRGMVVSNKMDKTVVVQVETIKRHPLYGKVIRTAKKYMAHDESNTVQEGSFVQIVESRPMSKNKRWAVETVLEAPTDVEAQAAATEEEVEEVEVEAVAVAEDTSSEEE